MENLLTQEDIRNLKELNSRLAKELKCFGLAAEKLPEQLVEQLDEYVEVQLCSGLSDMEVIKLREFYSNEKKQQLNQRLAVSKIKIEVNDLKRQIETEAKECELLDKFVNKYSNVKDDYQPTKLLLKKKLQDLERKQESFKIPDEVNIEELIKKIEILKQSEGESKK